MVRRWLSIAGVFAGGLVAGCGAATSGTSSPGTTTSPATAAPTLAAATPTPAATTLAGPTPSAASTSLDPCQLVTSQEASQLAGTTFGAGREQTDPSNAKRCFYGSQTVNVFTVEVVQAPDAATAQTAKAQAEADIKQTAPGITVTQLPNLADGAIAAQGSASASGATLNVSSIGVLKGTVFFGFSDVVVGHPAPTNAALEAEAQTVLGRLP